MSAIARRLPISGRELARYGTPLALLLLWEVLHRTRAVNPLFLPAPADVARVGRHLLESGALLRGWAASLGRLLAGFAIAAVLGVAGGTVLGVSRTAERAVSPTLAAVKQVSPFALLPLLSFWFGLGEPAKVAFITLTSVFPILVNTFEGVRSVAPQLLEVGRVYRLTRVELVLRIVLPAATPSIFAGLHLGAFFSWLGTVGAEYFMSSGPGLGTFIVDGRAGFRMDLVLLGIAAIGATGVLLNALLEAVERRLLRWRPRAP